MKDVQLDVVISVDETLVDLRRLRRRNLGFPFLELATFNIVYLMILRDQVVLLRRTVPRMIASIPVELMPPEAQQRVAAHLSRDDPR